MTRTRFVALAAFACAVLVGAAAAQDKAAPAGKEKDGKAVFLDNKCNTCHTMQALGIAKKKPDAAEEKEAKEEKSDKKAPDLSGIGLERKADWMAKYLMKKEAIQGEKHTRRFRGDANELAAVTTWLEAQKAKAKDKKK